MNLIGYVGSGKGYDGRRDWGPGLESILGFRPFPGTLNVAVKPIIADFEDRTIKVFDSFLCIKGTLNDKECLLCYSTFRKDLSVITTLYVIADCSLREMFDLKDKDKVTLRLFLDEKE
jgi:CTP-dependent riboflavin kinase